MLKKFYTQSKANFVLFDRYMENRKRFKASINIVNQKLGATDMTAVSKILSTVDNIKLCMSELVL